MPTAAAILFSLVMILLLWRGDPKRRRTTGQRGGADSAGRRCLLVAGTLAPGLILALGGDSAAFFVWLGICVIAGWLAAQIQGPGAAR